MKNTDSPAKPGSERTRMRPGRLAKSVGLPAIVLLAGGFLAVYLTPESSVLDTPVPDVPPPMVTVLPILDLDGERFEAFNAGLADEIAAGLAMVREVEILGRSSARSFTDVNRDARRAGARLGASVVLDATSKRSGGHFRVASRLIDTRSGVVIWSDVQETALQDWFLARDSIVAGVMSALGLTLEDEVRRQLDRRRTSLGAFELYALGRFGWAESEGGDLLEATSFLELAIDADSGFAPAWTALAEAYLTLPRFTRFPVESVRREGAAAARTALQLDPRSSAAHAALGGILFLYERDYPGGRAHLERAVELDHGNAYALVRQCELEMYMGRLSAAAESCRQAIEADVLSFQGAWYLANLQQIHGDFDAALAGLDSLRNMFPGYLPLSADVMFNRLLAGDTVRGHDDLRAWVALLGGSSDLAAGLSGDEPGLALRRVARIIDPAPSDMAALSSLLGDCPAALEAAAEAVRERDPGSLRFGVFPEFAELRKLEKFRALLDELNLPGSDEQ